MGRGWEGGAMLVACGGNSVGNKPGCGHNDPDCTGWTKEQTVERVTPDGNSEVVFSLKHGDNKGGCAVRLPNRGNTMVVLLGGGGAYWAMGEHHAHVEYYDKT